MLIHAFNPMCGRIKKLKEQFYEEKTDLFVPNYYLKNHRKRTMKWKHKKQKQNYWD